MAIGWFVAAYKRRAEGHRPTRYCSMDDFTSQIRADGGDWAEVEVLGNRAICKVRANAGTLTTIAGAAGIQRIPLTALNDPLSSLSNAQRTAIRNAILDAGYTVAEVNARFPNLANHTLAEVLRFFASRRLKPRYDSGTDTIICDGDLQNCESVDVLDLRVAA